MRTTLLAILTVVALWHAFMPGDAHAVISTATTIDGPSGDVVDLGGVAMAEDGTGGLVVHQDRARRAQTTYMRCGS